MSIIRTGARVFGSIACIVGPALAAAHENAAPEGARHGEQHSDERAARERALDRQSAEEAVLARDGDLHALLRREIEPVREAPRGRVMVFAADAASAQAAQALEDAVVVALFKREDLKPITATAAKRDVVDLPPECQETGGCMAQLARHLDTNVVFTCRMVTLEDTVTLELRVLDLERAEDIGRVTFARRIDDATEDMVGPAVAALFAPPRTELDMTATVAAAPSPPSASVELPAAVDGPPIQTRVPFFAVAGITSGALGYAIVSLVVGFSPNRDETYQTVGFALGGVAILGLAATITLAVLTDFSKDVPDEEDLQEEAEEAGAKPMAAVAPWVSPQGGGASFALLF